MKRINPGVEELELYEFRYALDNFFPQPGGWLSIKLDPEQEIKLRISERDYYSGIQLKPHAW